jgi:hypothetical protein
MMKDTHTSLFLWTINGKQNNGKIVLMLLMLLDYFYGLVFIVLILMVMMDIY